MELTREDALTLFRMMWSDMQEKFGDNPTFEQRIEYKEWWCRKKFPNERVLKDCFLCAYTKGTDVVSCGRCPVDWGKDGRYKNSCEKWEDSGVDWRKSPISEILALPEREDV